MDLYFKRHDGQAVTCEDFYAAMRDANNADFANFLLWYAIFSISFFFFMIYKF